MQALSKAIKFISARKTYDDQLEGKRVYSNILKWLKIFFVLEFKKTLKLFDDLKNASIR